MRLLGVVVFVAIPLSFAAGVFSTACSSSSSSPPPQCNQKLSECTASQTCWVIDTVPNFACLNGGAGNAGDSCMSTVNSPTCGAGLACFQQQQAVTGTCVPECDPTDPSRGCPTGSNCEPVLFAGSSSSSALHICISATGMDAGSDTGADSAPPVDTGVDTAEFDSGPGDTGVADSPSSDGPSE